MNVIPFHAKLLFIVVIISILVTVPVSAGYVVQDLEMNASYTYTANFIDARTGAPISQVSIADNKGYSTSTSTGSFSNVYTYGLITFTFSSSNYIVNTRSVLIDQNLIENVSLTPAGSVAAQTMYVTPKKVRFMCRDYRGVPIEGMTVSAVGIQSTLGAVDWVMSLFGINLDVTPITTTLMSGTTGSDGSIVFIMMETEKYRLQYSKASQGINETRYYYPKQEEYDEIFWTEEPPVSSTVITFVLYNTSANSTYMNLGVDYTDMLATTDKITFFVEDNSSKRIYSQLYPSPGYILNVSHGVPMTPGETYYWGFSANSTQYKKPINATHFITFDQSRWLIDPMGAGLPGANAGLVALATLVYNWASVGLIMIFALIFGRFSMKIGVVIVPLIGAVFKYIGWLEITWLVVSIALGLGIIISFRYSEEEASV